MFGDLAMLALIAAALAAFLGLVSLCDSLSR